MPHATGENLAAPAAVGLSTQLLEQAAQGMRPAQEEIMRVLRAYARHVCRGRPPAGAPDLDWEDVAQEAGRRMFAVGLERYRSGSPVAGYLYAYVKTAYLHLARGASRRLRREEQAEVYEPPSVAPNPETQTVLHDILGRISQECRELLSRLYFDGVTYGELALETGLAESSVRAKASRCLGRAREFVK